MLTLAGGTVFGSALFSGVGGVDTEFETTSSPQVEEGIGGIFEIGVDPELADNKGVCEPGESTTLDGDFGG